MKKVLLVMAFQFFGLVFGCATTGGGYQRPTAEQIAAQRRQNYVNMHPNLPPITKQDILEGKPRIGMTQEQVRACWGDPAKTQRFGNASGVREVWIYYSPIPDMSTSARLLTPAQISQLYSIALTNRKVTSLHFENGTFTSFEEQ